MLYQIHINLFNFYFPIINILSRNYIYHEINMKKATKTTTKNEIFYQKKTNKSYRLSVFVFIFLRYLANNSTFLPSSYKFHSLLFLFDSMK
jgi:hypothetical protein